MAHQKTYEEINEKIKRGEAVVVTAEEVVDIVAEQGLQKAAREIDVVTTGTFGPMCSSGVFLNFGHSRPRIKMSKVWLNGVEAYAGIAALAVEILIGYTIGFVAYMVFAALQLAGQLMDMQMGFGIVNVVDPQSGTQIPLMGNLTQTIALLLYLAIDGHHYLFQALIQSYKVIPVLGLSLNAGFYDLIFDISVYMFVIAVKIATPIIIAIMTADIAMGFIARTVPQMNVFIVGLPLKIMVGLGALFIMMPVYMWVFNILFSRFFTYLDQIIRLMGM